MKNKCATKGCKNKAQTNRTICNSCRSRKYRSAHPMEASFHHLKSNAKRRGHKFDLSFDEFKEFCTKTNYIVGKGKSKDSYTIDRIDHTKGYSIDNIQVMSNEENARKSNKLVYYVESRTFGVQSLNVNSNSIPNSENIF